MTVYLSALILYIYDAYFSNFFITFLCLLFTDLDPFL